MSSRVLREGDGGIAAPIAWRQVDGTAEKPGPADARAPGLGQRLEQMESQHRQAIEQARAAAFREGESAGRNQAAAQVQPVIERLARSVEELALLRPRLRREAEHDMLRLALAVARRVLRRELAVDPDALHGLALAALEKVSNQQVHRVRVHPSMAPQMRALLENPLPTPRWRWSRTRPGSRVRSSLKRNAATWTPRWNRNWKRSSAAWPTACKTNHEGTNFAGAVF